MDSFRDTSNLKQCILLSSTIKQEIGKILGPVSENRPKKVKNTFFGHLYPYNPGLRFFQKNHVAQTIHPVFLYNHAKNCEDPWSRFEEKAKKTPHETTERQTEGWND